MSNEELLEIVNEKGRVIQKIPRSEAERENHMTQNVLLLVFTNKSSVWIQKRPKTKKHFPGLWDISACGGMIVGETPEESMRREQKEEMGFSSDLNFVETFINEFPGEDGSQRRRLSHLFINTSDKTPLVTDEVDEFKLISIEKLFQDIKKGPKNFVPSFLTELEKGIIVAKKMNLL